MYLILQHTIVIKKKFNVFNFTTYYCDKKKNLTYLILQFFILFYCI